MPSYDSFMCPNCEHHFRVIWPEPVPTHYHLCSKIKMKCPDCNEVTELSSTVLRWLLGAGGEVQRRNLDDSPPGPLTSFLVYQRHAPNCGTVWQPLSGPQFEDQPGTNLRCCLPLEHGLRNIESAGHARNTDRHRPESPAGPRKRCIDTCARSVYALCGRFREKGLRTKDRGSCRLYSFTRPEPTDTSPSGSEWAFTDPSSTIVKFQ